MDIMALTKAQLAKLHAKHNKLKVGTPAWDKMYDDAVKMNNGKTHHHSCDCSYCKMARKDFNGN